MNIKYWFRAVAILSTAFALSFLSPGEAEAQRSFPCNVSQEYCDAVLNPFWQANDSTLAWYGSGDVDGNNIVNMDDYDAIVAGSLSDEADVDGDGTPSATQDQEILLQYLNRDIEYLPGMWNHLQTREEREAWNKAIEVNVDLRDTITWAFPDWISQDFAALGYFEGNGLPDTTNMPDKYKQYFDDFGRYNKPTHFVSVQAEAFGHGMNAILTGDDPLNFEDWNFIEPQNDSTDVQPGAWNIPYKSRVFIRGIQKIFPNGGFDFLPLVWFDIDSNGVGILDDYNEDLILERPIISVSTEEPAELLSGYKLSQNYPNPFNPETVIEYSLPRPGMVSLVIYDIMGREVTKLIEREMPSGRHKIQWHAKDVTSGVYLYRLKTGNFVQTNKMVLLR